MSTPEPSAVAPRRGATFWVAVVGAWSMIVYGVRGLIGDGVDLVGFAQWFIGIAVVHDAFVAPAVFAVAWLAGRLPRRVVVPVRVGLATSALLLVYAWPLAQGWGRAASNPSALPLDYRRNLLVGLAAIWFVVAMTATSNVLRSRRGAEGGRTA